MVRFIDDHRDHYGVEPICRVLPIARSTYFRREAAETDPGHRSARAQRDEALGDHLYSITQCRVATTP